MWRHKRLFTNVWYFVKMFPSLFLARAFCAKTILFPTRAFIHSPFLFWYHARPYFSLRHFLAPCGRIFVHAYFHLLKFIIRAPRYIPLQRIPFMFSPISLSFLSFLIYTSDEDVSKQYFFSFCDVAHSPNFDFFSFFLEFNLSRQKYLFINSSFFLT